MNQNQLEKNLRPMLIADIDNLPKAKKELERRLRYIAPMVKYGDSSRLKNAYREEWIELSDPYLKYFKNIPYNDMFPEIKPKRSADDEFLVQCLDYFDKRVQKINKSSWDLLHSEDYLSQMSESLLKREDLMTEAFLNDLPSSYEEWVSSPFLDQKQKQEMTSYMDEMIYERKEQLESKKVGRNELCPCGSGKKYKKCCMV